MHPAVSSRAALAEAKHLLRRITEHYISNNLTVEETREIASISVRLLAARLFC